MSSKKSKIDHVSIVKKTKSQLINILPNEILILILSFVFPKGVSLFDRVSGFRQLKTVSRLWNALCKKIPKIEYCLMKKFNFYEHKLPEFIPYDLIITEYGVYISFSFEGKDELAEVKFSNGIYDYGSYFVSLPQYMQSIYDGLFFLVDTSMITENFLKTVCNDCKKLTYTARYLRLIRSDYECNIDECDCYLAGEIFGVKSRKKPNKPRVKKRTAPQKTTPKKRIPQDCVVMPKVKKDKIEILTRKKEEVTRKAKSQKAMMKGLFSLDPLWVIHFYDNIEKTARLKFEKSIDDKKIIVRRVKNKIESEIESEGESTEESESESESPNEKKKPEPEGKKLSAYNLYVQKEYNKLVEQGYKNDEILKKIAKQWKNSFENPKNV
ncbi:14383_t:CDS:2 [Dentiscutata heterogama]|uniref:14383_t:CDS:1 n=1 Tax=Dentiscutata heterogama TaxID=1316150 RepID=A0ACA9JUX1_9GLOM|nr:14383_t:CDS:2 [Dentiscutata heterogama]